MSTCLDLPSRPRVYTAVRGFSRGLKHSPTCTLGYLLRVTADGMCSSSLNNSSAIRESGRPLARQNGENTR